MGGYPVSVNIKQGVISYWMRLILGKETKLCSIAYRLMFDLFNTHDVNFKWLTHVKAIFDECGLSYIWQSQNCANYIWVKAKIKQCLIDQFKQNWNEEIQTCSKTINYRLFKDTLEFEDYLNILDEK